VRLMFEFIFLMMVWLSSDMDGLEDGFLWYV